MNRLKPVDHLFAIDTDCARTEIATQFPLIWTVTELFEIFEKRLHRRFASHKAGQKQDGVAVALRCLQKEGRGPGQRARFHQGARQFRERK